MRRGSCVSALPLIGSVLSPCLRQWQQQQWDYKTRIHNQNELLTQLRAMLNNMLQQKQRFKDACIDTEAALRVTCLPPPA